MPAETRSIGKGYRQGRRRRKSGKPQDRTGEILDIEPKSSAASKGFKLWVRKERWVILSLILIFVLGLMLRAYFYYPVATEDGEMLSGNDPFYHKQVIDYVLEDHEHLTEDPLINYPLIGTNPRPPVYDWSSAISGMVLSPFFNGDIALATWTFFILSPALWGALTIFPVYLLSKETFGKKPALISATLMAIMASHIERCPAGFSDHDAMVLFFVVTSIYFLVRALGALKEKKWIENWRHTRDISIGINDFFSENKVAVGFSILGGLSIATVALIWKGFPYVFVIILGYLSVQLVFNHLKKVDSLGIFACIFITMVTSLAVSFPYYAFFTTGTWISPLYLLLAMIFVGIFLVPTRDHPWLIVIPLLITVIATILLSLNHFAPEIASQLFSGGGYFIRSKLYDTIAEAQAPDMSRLVISYGPVTFYLALIGLVLAAIDIPKQWKPNYMLIIIWCGLAIYMAMSAVRFMFNATPVFAILAGWVIWKIIEKIDPTMRTFRRVETKFIYLYVGIATLLVISLTYWRYYLEFEDFELFQLIFGMGLLGIFASLMAIFFIVKYNIFIGAIIFIIFAVIWVAVSWHDKLEIFLFGLLILGFVLVPIIILIGLRNKISGFRVELKHVGISLFLVFLIFTPNMLFAIDSAIPYESKGDYDPDGEILGAFGHSFPSEYWQSGMEWLSEQDTNVSIEKRPAFISWWDYGFWATYLGKHPTVADNFQAGYQLAGSFIAAQNESEAISLFAIRLLEGDHCRNHYDFSPETQAILIKYLDDGDQDDHPNTDRVEKLMDIPFGSESGQKALIKEVDNNWQRYGGNYSDLKIRNAVYAATRQVFYRLDMETIAELLREIEVSTGYSIRYFAVDTRLFPFTAQNTGIFYAPITLADRNVQEFITYMALVEYRTQADGEWQPYKPEPIPTSEIPGAGNDLGDAIDDWGQNNIRVKEYRISYTDMFYQSMFFHCYIGWDGTDVEHANDAVAGLNDNDQMSELDNYPPLQGWNMTHFRLVYRTVYWNPHNESELQANDDYQKDWEAMGEHEAQQLVVELEKDGIDNDKNGQVDDRGEGGVISSGIKQGVYFLKYYHGAIIQGQVTTNEEPKQTVPGVRVTVLDEFGIPHDVNYTDKNGNYKLIAPFGESRVIVSQGGFDENNYILSKLSSVEKRRLAGTTIMISEAQAQRSVPDYIFDRDFEIDPAVLEGTVHWDLNGNDEYDEDTDEPITDNNIELILVNSNFFLNISYDPTEINDGKYKFENVVPGDYLLLPKISSHPALLVNISDPLILEAGATKYENISIAPSSMYGFICYQNQTPASNIPIMLHDHTNDTVIYQTTAPNGTYKFDNLVIGEYTLIFNESGYVPYKEKLVIEEGVHNTSNFTLIRIGKVSGTTWYDKNLNGFDESDLLGNVRIIFKNLDTGGNTTLISDPETGLYEGELVGGNYTIYTRYSYNDISYVHLSKCNIKAGTDYEIPIELETSFRLNGAVYKLVGQTVENATITFESTDASGNLTQLFIPTNGTGGFRTYLPYREYSIRGFHISDPGKVPYLYFKNVDYSSIVPSRVIEIQVYPASKPYGYVFWDKNGDGNYSITNLSAELNEIISNLDVIFTHPNGTVTAVTNETGYYTTYIPLGLNYLAIDDERFETLNRSMTAEALTVFAPGGGEFIDGISRDIMVIPKNVTLKGTLWYDINGNDEFDPDNNEYLTDLPLEFINLSMGAKYAGTTSDEATGEYSVSLVPGIYNVSVDHTALPGNTSIYAFEANISIPYYSESTPEIEFDLRLTPLIKINYTIMYQDEILNHTRAGENLTIKFIDSTNNETMPLSGIENYYEGYLEVGNYTVWIEYTTLDNNNNTMRDIYLGIHLVRPGTGTKTIELSLGTKVKGNVFLDNNGNNTFDDETDESVAKPEIMFIRGDGTTVMAPSDSNGDFEVYLIPNHEYEITINYTTVEKSGGSDITVKYIYNALIELEGAEEYSHNISVTKYLKVTGTVYYDENENNIVDSGEGLNLSELNFKSLRGEAGRYRDEGVEEEEESLILATVSNATGYYELFLKPGGYEITVELFGFRNVPDYKNIKSDETIEYKKYELLQLNISLATSEIDLILSPQLVEVSGLLFYDLDQNLTYEPEEPLLGSDIVIEFIPDGYKTNDPNYLGFSTESILGQANEANKEYLKQTGENTFNRITQVKPIGDPNDSENFGKYSVLLTPGSYNINAYTDSNSGQLYAALANLQINIFEDSEYNLSMNKGMIVKGNVYYQDTDGNFVYDISKSITEGGLEFKSKTTDGMRTIGYENGFYEIILGYGNYSVSTNYKAREYDQDMEYSIDKILWIKDTLEPYDLELTKDKKYDVTLTVVGDPEKTTARGKYEKSLYTLEVKNNGNENTNEINLKVESAPEGWDVRLEPSTITLGLTEPNDSGKVTVDVTASLNALAENTILIKAEAKERTASSSTVELKVNTPKMHSFDAYTVEDTDRGLFPNSTINVNITVEMAGNTGDTLIFSLPNLPQDWNATVEAGELEVTPEGEYRHSYTQEEIAMVYKNVTLKIKSPDVATANLYPIATVDLIARSENTSDYKIVTIAANVREPDLTVTDAVFSNCDLSEGNNVTIQATILCTQTELTNVPVSLYINDELFEQNQTIDYIQEDKEQTVYFDWEPSELEIDEYKGKTNKFEIVVNGNQSIEESQPYNNALTIEKWIGPPEEEEEFNWRPIIALLAVIIAVIVAGVVYQRSKKV